MALNFTAQKNIFAAFLRYLIKKKESVFAQKSCFSCTPGFLKLSKHDRLKKKEKHVQLCFEHTF